MIDYLRRPMTADELRAAADDSGRVSVVVAVQLDALIELDIDGLNDHVSALATGSAVGLTDVGYEPAGVLPAQQAVLIRATGCVGDHGLG